MLKLVHCRAAVVFVWACALCGAVQGQPKNHVKISFSSAAEIRVQADLVSPARSWSFRNAYAGVLGIAERVESFRAIARDGNDARPRKIATGEFRSELDAASIDYVVRLRDPQAGEVSHVSWVVGNCGFLMLADLVPRDLESFSAAFVLPSGWSVESSIRRESNGRYQVVEPEKAVFFVGSELRKRSKSVDGMPLDVVLSGVWSFKDEDAAEAATRVMRKYLALTGFTLRGKSAVMIAPLPVAVGSTKWRAETRGSSVVLLMDPNAGLRNWPGQLGVIFTHELLHLWVPNSLKLQGEYDWFFEGFTLYTALRTALELKIITFKEFLATLARVYDSYLSYSDNVSLIEASERRWTTPGSLVYDKGMLAAFVYDLALRRESGGKTTLADRYRSLFSEAMSDQAQANEAIISLLGSSPALVDFTKSYIENASALELERLLPAYGLSMDSTGKSSQLSVRRELSDDQKRLLRSLGYRD